MILSSIRFSFFLNCFRLSLQFSFLGKPAAMVLALIMLVAFAMHLKVKDTAIKSAPSLAVLAVCVGIILL